MSCPLELVIARAVLRHEFRLGGSDLSVWTSNLLEGFKGSEGFDPVIEEAA
jgi:hypothetical protein